jgi:hypothetical protein
MKTKKDDSARIRKIEKERQKSWNEISAFMKRFNRWVKKSRNSKIKYIIR